jgi:hypothetical protein
MEFDEHHHKFAVSGYVTQDGEIVCIWRCGCGAWRTEPLDEDSRVPVPGRD